MKMARKLYEKMQDKVLDVSLSHDKSDRYKSFI